MYFTQPDSKRGSKNLSQQVIERVRESGQWTVSCSFLVFECFSDGRLSQVHSPIGICHLIRPLVVFHDFYGFIDPSATNMCIFEPVSYKPSGHRQVGAPLNHRFLSYHRRGLSRCPNTPQKVPNLASKPTVGSMCRYTPHWESSLDWLLTRVRSRPAARSTPVPGAGTRIRSRLRR